MPRRATAFLPDQYYHFYNRGNNRQSVFFDRENYLYFLRGIKKYVRGYVEVIAYCLMPTHYHILVRIKQLPAKQIPEVLKTSGISATSIPGKAAPESKAVSLAMQKFGISYTKPSTNALTVWGHYFKGSLKASLSNITIIC